MRQQIPSFRFSRENAAAVQDRLSGPQRSMVQAFERRLAASEYRLTTDGCPCGAEDDTVVAEIDRYGLPLTTVLCETCGTLRTNPYLDDSSLDDFYRTTYQTMYARAPQLEPYFASQFSYGARVAALYERELPPAASVLEIGCGAGGGLAAFQQRGYRVAGCELSRDLVEYGRTRGVGNLWHGTIDDLPNAFASQRWDLIFLHHVFEHVQSPSRLLQSLSARLAPQGRVLTIVPDVTRVDRFPNPAGDILKFLHVAHKFNYTAEGLEIVATKLGLAAAAANPPAGMKTAWSDMPELWMEFRAAAGRSERNSQNNHGHRLLTYLIETERRFLAGDYQQSSDISPTERPLGRRSRGPIRQFVEWLRGRRSKRAA